MLPEARVRQSRTVSPGHLLLSAETRLPAQGRRPCTLLLDAQGRLVGVDVDPQGARCVLMLGAHEDVASTRAAEVDIDGSEVVLRVPGLGLR